MGSFSWCRAETTTPRSNITEGDKYKILVPQEFGGGYIQDIYYDYGYVFWYLEDEYPKYVDGNGIEFHASEFWNGVIGDSIDLYGIIAWWNAPDDLDFIVPYDVADDDLEEAERRRPKTMYDILQRGCCYDNRDVGIYMCDGDGLYGEDRLKYPLKLVSPSYELTYEQCKGRSYNDPNQGFGTGYWKHEPYREIRKHMKAEAKKK